MNTDPQNMIPPMRVAHVVLGLHTGGLERVVVSLVLGMQKTGFQSLVIVLEEGGENVAGLERHGIPVVALNKRGGMNWRTILAMARLFQEHKVQLVHTHNPAPHLHGILAACLARVPARVHSKHGRNKPDVPRLVWLNRQLGRFTSRIVAVSDDVARVAGEVEKAPARKITVIRNGIDVRHFVPGRAGGEEVTGEHTRPFVIGSIGRFSADKNYPLLVKAFALFRKRAEDGGQGTGDRGQGTGDRGQGTGDRGQEERGQSVERRTLNVEHEEQRASVAELQRGGAREEQTSNTQPRFAPGASAFAELRRDRSQGKHPTSNAEQRNVDAGQGETSDSAPRSKVFPPTGAEIPRSTFYVLRSTVLLLVGDGPDRANIEKAIAECGVGDSVRLAGMQEDVLPWLRQMDVFCLPSLTEGTSLTLLEAGACGLPTVATNVGGNGEVVENEVTGMLVPSGDEKAMAAAFERLAGDSGLRGRMGEAARKRITEKYSVERMIAEYERVYREVTDGLLHHSASNAKPRPAWLRP